MSTAQIGDDAASVTVPPAPPERTGALALVRWMRSNNLINRHYAVLGARWLWLKLRYGKRLQTDGICFFCRGVKLEIGKDAVLRVGRWSWIGHGTKIRVHEGEVAIGAKTVMLIDFDHGVVEVERPIRLQGIYKRDVRVGCNVWIGYGACILRGVGVGHNSVIGTNAVVTRDVPENAVVGGAPARVLRMREAPGRLRWD
jgi:acetyltransferase-like isoleucine patch superfamily enzyme